jgi:YHS domain-containing protein
MVGWIIRLLLLYVILRAISRFVRGIVQGMTPPLPEPPRAVPLARDPVCGTFVVPSRAVTMGSGGDLRFFCSEKCRRTYEMNPAR